MAEPTASGLLQVLRDCPERALQLADRGAASLKERSMATTEPAVMLAPGMEVDVFSRFRETWVHGFEIAGVHGNSYSLRRRLDWAVLPGTFSADDIRVSRPRGCSPTA